jgi:hypothetical protein
MVWKASELKFIGNNGKRNQLNWRVISKTYCRYWRELKEEIEKEVFEVSRWNVGLIKKCIFSFLFPQYNLDEKHLSKIK